MTEQQNIKEDFQSTSSDNRSAEGVRNAVNQMTADDFRAMINQAASADSRAAESVLPGFGINMAAEATTETQKEGKNFKERFSDRESRQTGEGIAGDSPKQAFKGINEKFKELKDPKELLAKLDKLERPTLTKLEKQKLGELHDALSSGDLKATRDLLRHLAKNPDSAHRVLGELQRQMEKGNPNRMVGYSYDKQTGEVTLKISEVHGPNKGDPATVVNLSSDSPARATYYKHEGAWKLDPSSTLSNMLGRPRKK